MSKGLFGGLADTLFGSPDVPDYGAAAQAQGQANREVTEQQTWANRPDQVTPFGTTSWGNQLQWDPATQQYLNRWQQTTEVAPELKPALQNQFGVINARSQLANDLTGRLQDEIGNAPMDWSQFRPSGEAPDAQDYGNIDDFRQRQEDALYGRATSRLDPQWSQQEDALRTQLYNAGVREGDKAYDQQLENFRRARTDAYNQANFGAIAGGGAEAANQINMGGAILGQEQGASGYMNQLRQQDIAEALQQRGASLNEINAAMSGQQVAMPSMPNFQAAGQAGAAPIMQGAQLQGQGNLDQFNAQQGAVQGLMSGAGKLYGGMMG